MRSDIVYGHGLIELLRGSAVDTDLMKYSLSTPVAWVVVIPLEWNGGCVCGV